MLIVRSVLSGWLLAVLVGSVLSAAAPAHAAAKIEQSVTVALEQARVLVGATVTLSGSITPARAGVTVKLQHRYAGSKQKWQAVTQVKTGADGTYRAAVKLTSDADRSYRAYLPAKGSYRAAYSPASSSLVVDVAPLSAGGFHTCALSATGGAYCWGVNSDGQLGDGTSDNDRTAPVAVTGLSSGVKVVSAGLWHSCAVTAGGAVKCWGNNGNGRLGDGTNTMRPAPVTVKGLRSGVAAVAVGTHHTCALTRAGAVKCWGDNDHGQLGDATTTERWTPVPVRGLSRGVTAIAAGVSHTCALTRAGAVKCWGDGSYGQLGDGALLDRAQPVGVVGLTSGAAAVSAGDSHTCALTRTGAVKCWGDNTYGQLGDGSVLERLTPVAARGLTTGVAAVSAGGGHTCAVTTAGAARCWGENGRPDFEGAGKLGDGTTIGRLVPVDVLGLTSPVAMISAGLSHTCALTTAGELSCWGANDAGQLGDGTIVSRTTPGDPVGLRAG